MKDYWRQARRDARRRIIRNVETMRDVVSLALARRPTRAEVASWSLEERMAAWEWALRTHLRASDNNVRRVPAPPCIQVLR